MATSALAVQNWFETTLSGGINASDTDIGLNSVPTGTEGYLIIEPDGTTTREVIYYTSKTSNSVVLTSAANGRGVDGTTAQSHAAGATVRMQITSGYWNALQDGTALATSAITTAKVADSAITPAKLLTGTGSSWAWQSWTPTLANLTLGNGTLDCKYRQVGKTVYWRFVFTLGSTSSVGTNPTFTLPVTSVATPSIYFPIGWGNFLDASGLAFKDPGVAMWASTTVASIKRYDANNDFNSITSTAPFTWTTSDQFLFQGFYEAA